MVELAGEHWMLVHDPDSVPHDDRPVDLWVETEDGTGIRVVNAFWCRDRQQWVTYSDKGEAQPVEHMSYTALRRVTHWCRIEEPTHRTPYSIKMVGGVVNYIRNV